MDAARWLGNLAAWSAQAAILIAAASLTAWAFRLRAPRVRLAWWQIVLALCVLLPAVEPWRAAQVASIALSSSAARPTAAAHASPLLPWPLVFLTILAGGCVARVLWLAVGFGRLRRWRRTAGDWTQLPPYLAGLRAALAPRTAFRLSSSISGPVTFGLRHPVVLLPSRFVALPADAQEAIVCHELLHVRRRDWLLTIAEESIRALFWFHPAIWWLISRIQLAREQAVDAGVVAFTKNRTQYLQALLAMAGHQPAPDLAPATLFLRKRHLRRRVALLLEEVHMSKRSLISFCAAGSGVLLAAGWLALQTFPLQAAPAPQSSDSGPVYTVAPKYPQAARDKHIEGDVVLQIQIDADGHVSDAQPVSGPEELRAAAVEAVLKWRYSPKNMSLPASSQVTVAFKLSRSGDAAKIRVDPQVQRAKLVFMVHPVYPPEAKAKGIQGVVELRTTIGKDGHVEDVQVTSGDPVLAAAAVEAVRQWRYSTTLLNGDPVAVITDIHVNFTLAK